MEQNQQGNRCGTRRAREKGGGGSKKITDWLEEFKQPFPPSEPPEECRIAVDIWFAMGRTLDWNALPVLVEIYGVPDPEELIVQLVARRDFDWPKQR